VRIGLSVFRRRRVTRLISPSIYYRVMWSDDEASIVVNSKVGALSTEIEINRLSVQATLRIDVMLQVWCHCINGGCADLDLPAASPRQCASLSLAHRASKRERLS
jgi:hypothetical protein